jgi:hypothetical protein
MTPHKIIQESLGEKLLNKYQINSSHLKVKSWVKTFSLDAGSGGDGRYYEGRLYWNDDDGYSIFFDGAIPSEAELPEFNYILDSLTRQDYK